MRSLYARLVVSIVVSMAVLAGATWWVSASAARSYYDELSQRLNGGIAMYVDRAAPLIVDGVVDNARVSELGARAMVINPIAEVYVLDAEGRIVGHALPAGQVRASSVDLKPVRAFLAGQARGPVYGDNPRAPDDPRVFSAAEIRHDGRLEGYVYVVIGGERHRNLAAALAGSFVLRSALALTAGLAVVAAILAWALTRWLTLPLQQLRDSVGKLSRDLDLQVPAADMAGANDIVSIRAVFDSMAGKVGGHVNQLRELDRLRRELFANISHDLRTPLTAMRGYLETLQLRFDTLTAGQRTEFVDIAVRHCARLGRLVDQLFSLARLDATTVRLAPEPLSLAELAQDTVGKYRLPADAVGVRLALEVDPSVPAVMADIGLTECVFENLLDNAIRHTPHGGTVTLRVLRTMHGVAVEVADTGPGIDPSDLERVQRPFEAGPGGRTGLGLAIVRRVLELHAAELQILSARGRGTTARFELAASIDERRDLAATPPADRQKAVMKA